MPRARWRCWRTLAMAALIACARPAAADVTTEIEKGIGRWMAQAFIAQRGRLDQPPIDDWITGLGRHLLEHTPRRSLEHRFIVLDSPEVNGFALPGGWVFVTAGLLETMNSEDELAAVMAHELGHVANRDFQRVLLRTALWLGLAEVLRSNDAGDWVPLVHGVQLVETLGHSRRREAQADATGARIAWGAGYDPRAMAAFLGDAPKWSYLQTVFSTHPHPARRSGRLDARFSELRAADPDGALALARSLIERGRGSAAAEVLADPLAPTHEDERAALLARLHERPAAPPEAHDRITLSPEQAAAVVKAVSASRQARVDSKEAREAAWQRLRRLWDDRQVQQGLVVAQAVDPEPGNPGYLLLVAQSVNLLHRSMRGGNLVGRTLQMREEAARELEALGGRAGGGGAAPGGGAGPPRGGRGAGRRGGGLRGGDGAGCTGAGATGRRLS
ncbi:MAG: M48 family metalloprotease [Armatimonadota bacterium]